MGRKVKKITCCGYCDAEVGEDDLVCEVCGAEFVEEEEPQLCDNCGAEVGDCLEWRGTLYSYRVRDNILNGNKNLCTRCSMQDCSIISTPATGA